MKTVLVHLLFLLTQFAASSSYAELAQPILQFETNEGGLWFMTNAKRVTLRSDGVLEVQGQIRSFGNITSPILTKKLDSRNIEKLLHFGNNLNSTPHRIEVRTQNNVYRCGSDRIILSLAKFEVGGRGESVSEVLEPLQIVDTTYGGCYSGQVYSWLYDGDDPNGINQKFADNLIYSINTMLDTLSNQMLSELDPPRP